MVAEINGVASAELNLHRHLFGTDRILPPHPLRDGIAALQGGRCFYCHHPLCSTPRPTISSCGSATASTHEKLVLAGLRCNNGKRDLLPGPAHVTAWASRNGTTMPHSPGWLPPPGENRPAATIAVARSIYSHLPRSGTPLWLGRCVPRP